MLPVIDVERTGERIGTLRKQAGFSVRELQGVFGFQTPQAVYKWQCGKALPSLDNLVGLARVLGVTIDDIIVLRED